MFARFTAIAILGLVGVFGLSSALRAADAALKVGDAAPGFELVGSDGKTYKLADLKGRTVIVAWFPRAFTGGCTAECKSMKEDGALLRKYNVAYFTASNDPQEKNAAFAKSLGLDYPILSDPTSATCKAYGVFNAERNAANRVTFIIGPDGKLLDILTAVNTKTHAADLSKRLQQLGVADASR